MNDLLYFRSLVVKEYKTGALFLQYPWFYIWNVTIELVSNAANLNSIGYIEGMVEVE